MTIYRQGPVLNVRVTSSFTIQNAPRARHTFFFYTPQVYSNTFVNYKIFLYIYIYIYQTLLFIIIIRMLHYSRVERLKKVKYYPFNIKTYYVKKKKKKVFHPKENIFHSFMYRGTHSSPMLRSSSY